MTRQHVWGRTHGRADRRWRLTLDDEGFTLSVDAQVEAFRGADAEQLRPLRSWWRRYLQIATGGAPRRLYGLPKDDVEDLERAIRLYLARWRASDPLRQAVAWHRLVEATLGSSRSQNRWISHETTDQLLGSRPTVDPRTWFEGPDAMEFAESLSPQEKAALGFLHEDLAANVRDINDEIFQSELRERREFFDTVESSPLTDEQARAVVAFDNRVQVIAAAGSGKTSVMVARAAYAISRGFVSPDRILLLAFNRAAADELQARLDSRLSALGIPTDGLRASTFHSFGLEVIGRARGRKPRAAPWLDTGQDIGMISRIVDELREESSDFRFKWDLFRLLFARVSEAVNADEYDAYDRTQRRAGFSTFRGEVVKSEGERMIADWLYLNGVDYRYEQPYIHDVANEKHAQYRPDFFYPDVDVWHEHWALDHEGKPPPEFAGYSEAMAWKRDLHRARGTTLLETTWADIITGTGFENLQRELETAGLELDWNPDRPIPGGDPVRHEELARLARSFMTHVKSNGWTREQLIHRCSRPGGQPGARTRLFLDLYWQIHARWNAKLAAEDCVDFEDMLVQAAEHVESGQMACAYTLVMVDEFQDVSQARARLTRALVSSPGTYLLTVGDDWQSINRFAGADLGVMTHFESWFGPALQLRLETTFRCPQSICDVSSAFVMRNPQQLRKTVRSAKAGSEPAVKLLYVKDETAIPAAIAGHLDLLQTMAEPCTTGRGDRVALRVDVLGRYRFERDLVPASRRPAVDVTFRTVHSSKGLEADYVIVPNLTRGRYGFPSEVADDPLMNLVMSEPDAHPFAEERRLFYVALTRAKRGVLLIATQGKESVFVRDLLDTGLVKVIGDATALTTTPCPRCSQGLLTARRGPYGEFLGCSAFPRCRHTEKLNA